MVGGQMLLVLVPDAVMESKADYQFFLQKGITGRGLWVSSQEPRKRLLLVAHTRNRTAGDSNLRICAYCISTRCMS